MTDPITAAFSAAQGFLAVYLGLAIGVIVAALLLGVATAVLVRYVKRAERAASNWGA